MISTFALSSRLVAIGALVFPLASQVVSTPTNWVSGDTHEMVQLCTTGGSQPPDRPLSDVYGEMIAKDLNVMEVLVLVTGPTSCWQYLGQYAPLVTGVEETITQSDPNRMLYMGCEVVGGPDPLCPYPAWGHVVGIGINDAAYILDADYPALNLDFFKAQPNALTGYPHVSWPAGVRVPEDFPPIERSLTRLHPLLAPFDIAAGRVDFISTPDVATQATVITPYPWWGLWYKLLNVGMRVSITGGTVAQCYTALGNLDARTYALLDSAPLTRDGWLDAIDKGRTSIADGVEDFVLIEVDGQDVGSNLDLTGPTQVNVHAELHTSVPRQTTLEIIQDGVVVASDVVDLQTAGVHTFDIPITVNESGWFAARTQNAHTGAIFAYVDNRPITDEPTAQYFMDYGRQILNFLSIANGLCNLCPNSSCPACVELELWVGSSEPAIRNEIQHARDVFRAIRNYERPLPGGSVRYGSSTPSCQGPSGIGIKVAPTPGNEAVVQAFNGPPNTMAVLAVGRAPEIPPKFHRGAQRYVSLVPYPQMYDGVTDAAGYVEFNVPVGLSPSTIDAYTQVFFCNTPECPGTGTLSATEAMQVTIRPGIFFER